MQSMKHKEESVDFILSPDNAGTENIYSLFVRRLTDRNWYSFWGPVTDVSCEQCGLFLMNAMLGGVKDITLVICSGGGTEDDSRALIGIMELCKQSGMTIRALGLGCVASAALDIFMACSPGYRFAFEVTMFMMHSSAAEVRDKAMFALQQKFDMWTLASYSTMSPAIRKKILDTGNWWFGPEKMMDYGIVDAVIKRGEGIPEGPVIPVCKKDEQEVEPVIDEVIGE